MHFITVEKEGCLLTRNLHHVLLKRHFVDYSHSLVGKVDGFSIRHVVCWNLSLHVEILSWVLLMMCSLLLSEGIL